MSDRPQTTDHQRRTMRAAWDALLAGDTRKRDTIMRDMEQARLMDAREGALQKLVDIDFFVRSNGVVMRSSDIRRVVL